MSIEKLIASLSQVKKNQVNVEEELRRLVAALDQQFKTSSLGLQKISSARGDNQLFWNPDGFAYYDPKRGNGARKILGLNSEEFLHAMELMPALLAQLVMTERALLNTARESLNLSCLIMGYANTTGKAPPPKSTEGVPEEPVAPGRFGMID